MTTHPEVPQATAREEARALTVRQPWASLISTGVKTIETRGWSTKYRGPLLIHAGLRRPGILPYAIADALGVPSSICAGYRTRPDGGTNYTLRGPALPLGAVVASCRLADCVPITLDYDDLAHAYEGPAAVEVTGGGALLLYPKWSSALEDHEITEVTDQEPFGDFSPGRYAWLLDDIKPTAEPIPCRGKQGLWVPPPEAAPLFRAPFIEAQREEA